MQSFFPCAIKNLGSCLPGVRYVIGSAAIARAGTLWTGAPRYFDAGEPGRLGLENFPAQAGFSLSHAPSARRSMSG